MRVLNLCRVPMLVGVLLLLVLATAAPASAAGTLTIEKVGDGTGTIVSNPAGIDCGDRCSAEIDALSVGLTATAGPNSVFVGWEGGTCSAFMNFCTVGMSESPTTVTARFAAEIPLNMAVVGSGTIRDATTQALLCGIPSCKRVYSLNQLVKLTAAPQYGHVFTGWSGGDCTGTDTCTVTMSEARNVTATFTPLYTLTVTPAFGGKVTSPSLDADCVSFCSKQFLKDTVVTLTAVPNPGYRFAGWINACPGTMGSCELTMSSGKSLSASFTRTISVSVTKKGSGEGTVTDNKNPNKIFCGTTCSGTYDQNENVSLTAAPAAGSRFAGWTNCSFLVGQISLSPICTVLSNSDRAYDATFTKIHELKVVRAGNGTGHVYDKTALSKIDCRPITNLCDYDYDEGTSVTLVASPDHDMVFTGWSGGGCSGTEVECTVTMDQAREVTANFAKGRMLTILSSPFGGVTDESGDISCIGGVIPFKCAARKVDGEQVTLTVAPVENNQGQVFRGWTGACSGTTTTCTITMDAAKTVGTLWGYKLDVSKTGAGSGTVTDSGTTALNCGAICSMVYEISNIMLWPSADPGSRFIGWTGCTYVTGNVCNVSMNAARSVTANFEQVGPSYDVKVTKAGAGTGTVTDDKGLIWCGTSCTGSYESGTAVRLTAAAQQGSKFAGWSGECSGTGPTCDVTVTQARDVTATFAPKPRLAPATDLQPSFGQPANPGRILGTAVKDVLVQPGGGIVEVGYNMGFSSAGSNVFMRRRLANGSIDCAFGAAGTTSEVGVGFPLAGQDVPGSTDKFTNDFRATAVGQAANGDLFMAGIATVLPSGVEYVAIVRTSKDGAHKNTAVWPAAVKHQYEVGLVESTPDGGAVAVLRHVVSTMDSPSYLFKTTSTGAVHTAFGTGGRLTLNSTYVNDVTAVDRPGTADDVIVAAWRAPQFTSRGLRAYRQSDGGASTFFGGQSGTEYTAATNPEQVTAVGAAGDQRLVAAGSRLQGVTNTRKVWFQRFTSGGTSDPEFGPAANGNVDLSTILAPAGSLVDLKADGDGNLLLAGTITTSVNPPQFDLLLAGVTASGSPDTDISASGVHQGSSLIGSLTSMAIAPDGHWVLNDVSTEMRIGYFPGAKGAATTTEPTRFCVKPVTYEVAPAGVSFAGSGLRGDQAVEKDGFVSVLIKRSAGNGPSFVPVEVKEGTASSGLDYEEPTDARAFFADGQTIGAVSIKLKDDGIVEGPETLTVTTKDSLGGAVNGTGTYTIVDDDKDPEPQPKPEPQPAPAPPDPPAPSATDPTPTSPSAGTGTAPATSDGTVAVPMSCPFTARAKCQGSIELRGTGARVRQVVAQAAQAGAVLGTGSFDLAPGQTSSVPVRLTAAGKSQLAQQGKLTVVPVAIAEVDGRRVETRLSALTISAAPAPAAASSAIKAKTTSKRAGAKSKLTTKGRVTPAGAGCAGGRVQILVKAGAKTLSKRTATLNGSCSFTSATAVKAKKGQRLKVTVSFLGTPAVAPSVSRPTSVKA